MRQRLLTEFDPCSGVSIATLSYEYPRGHRVPEHAHGSSQLIYATHGVMEVSAGHGLWMIPPHFAVWIPARVRHSIQMRSEVSMRTLYVRRALAAGLPPACTVLHIAPLLRELIVEAVRLQQLRERDRLHCALRDLLLSQLAVSRPVPISVTMPKDERARNIAAKMMRNPAARQPLAGMCVEAGVSVRSIERIFRREVGSSVEIWRRQVRLMKAVELLVAGCSVKQASSALGYRQPTAFVEMFRGVLGATPKAWVLSLEQVR